MVAGEQYVMITGEMMMPVLCVNSSATLYMVIDMHNYNNDSLNFRGYSCSHMQMLLLTVEHILVLDLDQYTSMKCHVQAMKVSFCNVPTLMYRTVHTQRMLECTATYQVSLKTNYVHFYCLYT